VGLAAGCDAPREPAGEIRTPTASADTPHPAPEPIAPATRAQAPKPEVGRITFDPTTRRLTLYELSDRSARWMIVSAAAATPVPVDREHDFPPGMDIDLEHTTVFYTIPNRRPSPAVSLREILDAQHTQALR